MRTTPLVAVETREPVKASVGPVRNGMSLWTRAVCPGLSHTSFANTHLWVHTCSDTGTQGFTCKCVHTSQLMHVFAGIICRPPTCIHTEAPTCNYHCMYSLIYVTSDMCAYPICTWIHFRHVFFLWPETEFKKIPTVEGILGQTTPNICSYTYADPSHVYSLCLHFHSLHGYVLTCIQTSLHTCVLMPLIWIPIPKPLDYQVQPTGADATSNMYTRVHKTYASPTRDGHTGGTHSHIDMCVQEHIHTNHRSTHMCRLFDTKNTFLYMCRSPMCVHTVCTSIFFIDIFLHVCRLSYIHVCSCHLYEFSYPNPWIVGCNL